MTNNVIFQVDMSVQRSVFGPDSRDGYVFVSCIGSFNGWDEGSLLMAGNGNIYEGAVTSIGQPEEQIMCASFGNQANTSCHWTPSARPFRNRPSVT